MTVFPAALDTYIIELALDTELGFVRTPVVGWTRHGITYALPITPIAGVSQPRHGRAILHPDGFVSDPTHGLVFATPGEWLSFMQTAKAPAATTETEVEADTETETGADDDHIMPRFLREAAPKTPVASSSGDVRDRHTEPRVAVGALVGHEPIDLSGKPYKTKSYWKCSQPPCIFEIPGGDHRPDDARCEKITRDEFTKLKKAGYSVGLPDESSDSAGLHDDVSGLI